jgi:hypothetical protein
MSRYTHHVTAIATNLEVGNALARLIGLGDGDSLTFTKGVPLRQIGGDGSVVARAATVLLTERGAQLVAEFLSGGPFTELNTIGADDSMIAYAKTCVFCDLTTRENIGSALDFYAPHGYEPLPPPSELPVFVAEAG